MLNEESNRAFKRAADMAHDVFYYTKHIVFDVQHHGLVRSLLTSWTHAGAAVKDAAGAVERAAVAVEKAAHWVRANNGGA